MGYEIYVQEKSSAIIIVQGCFKTYYTSKQEVIKLSLDITKIKQASAKHTESKVVVRKHVTHLACNHTFSIMCACIYIKRTRMGTRF